MDWRRLAVLACFPAMLMAKPLSLDEAWQQLDNDSALLAAERQASKRAEGARDAAADLGLPSLDLSGSYVQLEKPLRLEIDEQLATPIGALPIDIALDLTERQIYRTSLTGAFPIYAGGRIEAAQKIKQAELEASMQQVEIRRRERFNLLVQRYYGVVLTKQNLDLRQQQVDARKTHFDHATLLEQQGQIAAVERLNAQVALDNAKVEAKSAQHQVKLAQYALNSLLQQAVEPTPYQRALVVPPLAPLEQRVGNEHPALLLFDAKQRQAKGAIAAEKGRYKPSLGLFGSYTLAEDNSILSHLEPEWFVGIRFSMPIFANDGRSGRLRAARSAELEARYRRQQTKQDLLLLLQSQHQAVEQAAYEYQAYASTVELATENRRLRQLAFQQGLATSLQLVDADQSLTAAQLARAQAQYHYLVALAQVVSLGGNFEPLLIGTNWESSNG
ncbi:TolC family protein [Ferrimonas lipolytica]|uniref:TolC family protein n=1 Tax=Ferrimonas lipolytica TaxID=2724191 RepID=A0A6H1UFS7_9GAMM|nr:TolC family protein [Ferrimonas lipolytica]QIZ77904.1 TolC family protein [Ferrimonas lipolytica]